MQDLTIVLTALRHKFAQILGDQLEAMYLYGSQARGDARPDSDIDILAVMRSEFDYDALIDRTSDIVSELSLEYDVVISRAFVSKDAFEHGQTPFLLNVRREGVAI